MAHNIATQNLHTAYHELLQSVNELILIHRADNHVGLLNEETRRCILLMQTLEQNRIHYTLDPQEYNECHDGIQGMLDALQAARTASRDVPDHEAPSFGGAEPQGGVGRPQIDIRPDDIAALRTGRTSHTQLAEIYGCNPRTIRRRLLEFNMSTPGPPVYVNEVLPDGSSTRVYSAGRSSDLSRISDEDLDQLMRSIYQQFPSFGRRMIDGYLMALGHRVPRKRVIESYQRVVGPPVATFRRRRIQRRVYSVAGPGALWHHDGQHGLIRWKIVIHAFIDGFSRYLLGIRASNNNRAETVAALFDELVARHGYPVRVRGDHGTENLLVAARMERQRGPGSYIWGKSVHNIRIERLWVDVTSGFGKNWKEFFYTLETSHGLNVESDYHIWLLQHLYLPQINVDATTWMMVWNNHTLSRRNQPHRTPAVMYVRGTLEHGQRGVFDQAPQLSQEELDAYGIDWDELENRRVRDHHERNNAGQDQHDEAAAPNPFGPRNATPATLSHIDVPTVNCPFSQEQLIWLNDRIAELPSYGKTDFPSRLLLWIEVTRIIDHMYR